MVLRLVGQAPRKIGVNVSLLTTSTGVNPGFFDASTGAHVASSSANRLPLDAGVWALDFQCPDAVVWELKYLSSGETIASGTGPVRKMWVHTGGEVYMNIYNAASFRGWRMPAVFELSPPRRSRLGAARLPEAVA